MEKRRVEVFCVTEGSKVGDLELEPGRRRITAMLFTRSYVPVEGKYMMARGVCRDGQFAKCPNCQGLLELHPTEIKGKPKVDTKEKEAAIKRAVAIAEKAEHKGVQFGVQRHIHNEDDGHAVLQLGTTTIEVE